MFLNWELVLLNIFVVDDALPEENRVKEEPDPDVRISQMDEDQTVEMKNEFFDGDQDNDKTDNEP